MSPLCFILQHPGAFSKDVTRHSAMEIHCRPGNHRRGRDGCTLKKNFPDLIFLGVFIFETAFWFVPASSLLMITPKPGSNTVTEPRLKQLPPAGHRTCTRKPDHTSINESVFPEGPIYCCRLHQSATQYVKISIGGSKHSSSYRLQCSP